MIKPVLVRDMTAFVKSMQGSFAEKRIIYGEFQSESIIRGFNFTKEQFVKEKFPKFPIRLRKQIQEII